MKHPVVIKVGGHEIADEAFLTELAIVIRDLVNPVVIVHGGGKEISAMQQKLGIEPQYIDGVRVTDAESLAVVTMILCGIVNKRLVRCLLAQGIDAQGMSGIDRGIIRAQKMQHATMDMGFTGEVVTVQAAPLLGMIQQDVTPVIAPICIGDRGEYNVNADHVAGAVAAAIKAERLIFLTNVEGVLSQQALLQTLTRRETNTLIHDGIISGGMIPKVEMALSALEAGVERAAITNLNGLKTHGGTLFINQIEREQHASHKPYDSA